MVYRERKLAATHMGVSVIGMGTHSKHIIHESASTGPNFYELDTFVGSALAEPFGHEPYSDELAEDL